MQKLGRKERDEREEAEERRRRTSDGAVTPLPLRFQAEVSARLFEGDLRPPATAEPAHDLHRRFREVRTEERLRGEAALDSVVEAEDDRTGGGKAPHEEAEQDAARLAATPDRSTQHAVIVHEVL